MTTDELVDSRTPKSLLSRRGVTAVLSVGVLLPAALLTACSAKEGDKGYVFEQPTASSVAPAASVAGGEAEISDAKGFSFLVANDKTIAGKSEDKLYIGTAQQWESNSLSTATVDRACTDLSRAQGGFSLACPDHVLVFDSSAQLVKDIKVSGEATTAAVTDEGASVTIKGKRKIQFYDSAGKSKELAGVGADPKQSVIIDPDSGRTKEMAAVFDGFQSSLTGIYHGEDKEGSSLRIGAGAAQISGGQKGVVVASSPNTDVAEVFTADDVLLKHQIITTGPQPWGVTWDPTTSTVWVTTTGDNKVTGYDISSGAAVKIAELATIADAETVTVDGEGGLLIASPSGNRVQRVTKEQIADAKQAGSSTTTTYSVEKK